MGHRVLIALAVCLLSARAGAGPTGRVVGKVAVTEPTGKPAGSDVIVYVYVVGFTEPGTANKATAKIAQQDRKFVPDLVAVTAGEAVSFPNGDPFLHNVFSQSAARKFDLGSFKRGDVKDKAFPQAGVIDVYCNIHPEMAATILVLPNKRHVRTAPDTAFVIDGVPPGTWTVFAYTRRAAKPGTAKVTVEAGKDAEVALSITRGAEPEHRNKFGEKYHAEGATYR